METIWSQLFKSCVITPKISSYGYWMDFSLAFDLKYAKKTNGVWAIETVDKEGDVRKWTSLDLDLNGRPHISYYDYTDGALKYAFFDGGSWHKESVETEGSTGCFNCLSLNSDNKPCISYYDWGNKALKYTFLSDNEWVVQTIEIDTNTDFLDQQQNYCCGYANPITDEEPLAQSFIPTYPVLTRVELMVVKRYDPKGFTVSIRNDLNGVDLTSIYLPANEIAEDLSWKNFDFPDLEVNPGETYYIVCSSEDTEEYDMYYWYYGIHDSYLNGCGWIKNGDWNVLTCSAFPDMDLGFRTFGLDTGIPSIPVINGPSNGKIGVEYEYNFTSVDPDGDDVWHIVEWDETNSGTFGPYNSGETVTLGHSWSRRGNYVIRAKAVDPYGAESDWATLSISMPNNKIIAPFERFLDNHPNMFPILRYLLEP